MHPEDEDGFRPKPQPASKPEDRKHVMIHVFGIWTKEFGRCEKDYFGGQSIDIPDFDPDKLSYFELFQIVRAVIPDLEHIDFTMNWLCNRFLSDMNHDHDIFWWWREAVVDENGYIHVFIELPDGITIEPQPLQVIPPSDDVIPDEVIPEAFNGTPEVNVEPVKKPIRKKKVAKKSKRCDPKVLPEEDLDEINEFYEDEEEIRRRKQARKYGHEPGISEQPPHGHETELTPQTELPPQTEQPPHVPPPPQTGLPPQVPQYEPQNEAHWSPPPPPQNEPHVPPLSPQNEAHWSPPPPPPPPPPPQSTPQSTPRNCPQQHFDSNVEPEDVHPEEGYHSSHTSDDEDFNQNMGTEPSRNEYAEFVNVEADNLYTHEETEPPGVSPQLEIKDLFEGQTWPTMTVAKNFIRRYAIAKKFVIHYECNDQLRIRAKCKDPACKWKANVRLLGKDGITGALKSFNNEHTCSMDALSKNSMATGPFIAEELKEEIMTHYQTFRPKDIVNQAWKSLQVRISYHVAWKARYLVLEKMFGNYEISFALTPEMCRQIIASNPGSVATFSREGSQNNFTGLCIAFRASLEGFVKGCRPLLGLDGCFLKGKYLGCILSINALDGNNGLFPVALYVCNAETYENWFNFLEQLAPHLTKHAAELSFISDRSKGLVEAVAQVFPTMKHRFCFRHMYKNFKQSYKGDLLEELSWNACKCYKETGHVYYMDQVRKVSTGAYNWLAFVDSHTWSRAYFDTTSKCEHVSNNFSESFNNWILKLRDTLVCNFVQKYHLLLMTCMYERRKKCKNWDQDGLVPRAVELIKKHESMIYDYIVLGSDNNKYCVNEMGTDARETVNLHEKTCTCRQWDVTGIPCVHAVAVIKQYRSGWKEWCSPYHTVKAYANAYGDAITPLADIKEWKSPEYVVQPPQYKRPPGRPRKNRIRDEDELYAPTETRQRLCGRCGQSGHNKKTCKGPINNQKEKQTTASCSKRKNQHTKHATQSSGTAPSPRAGIVPPPPPDLSQNMHTGEFARNETPAPQPHTSRGRPKFFNPTRGRGRGRGRNGAGRGNATNARGRGGATRGRGRGQGRGLDDIGTE